MRQPEGFKAIQIKTGRSKWRATPPGAEVRDIAVTLVVRSTIGRDAKLFVDGNRDYGTRLKSVIAYAEAVRPANGAFL